MSACCSSCCAPMGPYPSTDVFHRLQLGRWLFAEAWPNQYCQTNVTSSSTSTSIIITGAVCRGVSFNQYFNDFSNYTNAWLHQLLEEGEAAHANLAVCVESWRRQRQYVDWALEVGHCWPL